LYPLVIFHRSVLTTSNLTQVQSLAIKDFSIPLVPLLNPDQISQLLLKLHDVSNMKNPFRIESEQSRSLLVDKDTLLVLMAIPGPTEKKARLLLQTFSTIRSVTSARSKELEPILGANLTQRVENFFRRKNTI
jgi:ERCC4-type nuclease